MAQTFAGWKAVEPIVKLDLNWEQTPLEIRTSASSGSDKKLYLHFEDENEAVAGGVVIAFSYPMTYHIGWCTDYPQFPSAILPEAEQTWTLIRTSAGVKILYMEKCVKQYIYTIN